VSTRVRATFTRCGFESLNALILQYQGVSCVRACSLDVSCVRAFSLDVSCVRACSLGVSCVRAFSLDVSCVRACSLGVSCVKACSLGVSCVRACSDSRYVRCVSRRVLCQDTAVCFSVLRCSMPQ